MTLAYEGTISMAGTLQDVCNRTGSGELIVLNSSVIRRYDIATRAQVGSDYSISGYTALAMISANKAAVMAAGSSTVQIVDVSAGTGVSVTSMDTTFQSQKAQQVAGLIGDDVGIGVGGTVGRLIKFVAATNTASILTPRFLNAQNALCIIPKLDTDTFLVGTNKGVIAEIDQSGIALQQYRVSMTRMYIDGSTSPIQKIDYLSYSYGFVFAFLSTGEMVIIDHGTGRECGRHIMYNANSTSDKGGTVAGEADGPTLIIGNRNSVLASNHNSVLELDCLLTPVSVNGRFNMDTVNEVSAVGIQGSRVWATNNNGSKIIVMTLSSTRSITTQTKQLSPGGTPTEGDIVVINDTASPPQVMIACPVAAAGRDVPVTTGVDMINIASIGVGQDAVFDVRTTSS